MARSIKTVKHPLWVELVRRRITQKSMAVDVGMKANSYLCQMLNKTRPMPPDIEAEIWARLKAFDQE